VGRIEVRTREQSPTWRAGFHRLEHLLGPVGIARQVDVGTHLFDEKLVRAAEHYQSLSPILEVCRDVFCNRWSPRGECQALLTEHAEPAIAKQRRQQQIAVHVVSRASAHRRDCTAAEDRASVGRGWIVELPARIMIARLEIEALIVYTIHCCHIAA
jgi:hypothetical protein